MLLFMTLLGLITFHFPAIICFKILNIGELEADQKFNATIQNAPNFNGKYVSMCWWVNIPYRRSVTFIRYPAVLSIMDYYGTGKVLFFLFSSPEYNRYDVKVPDGKGIVPHSWTFLCFTYDNQANAVGLYLNAGQIFFQTNITDLAILPTDFLQRTIFPLDSNSGNLTGVNIWSKILTPNEIEDIYNCGPGSRDGDLMDWDNIIFDVMPANNVIKVTTAKDDEGPCQTNRRQNILFDAPATMHNGREPVRICSALGGEFGTLEKEEDMQELDNFKCSQGAIWAPVFKDGNTWRDHRNNPVSFLPWFKGKPMGESECALYHKSLYYDVSCSTFNCFFCRTKNQVVFKFIGHIHFIQVLSFFMCNCAYEILTTMLFSKV